MCIVRISRLHNNQRQYALCNGTNPQLLFNIYLNEVNEDIQHSHGPAKLIIWSIANYCVWSVVHIIDGSIINGKDSDKCDTSIYTWSTFRRMGPIKSFYPCELTLRTFKFIRSTEKYGHQNFKEMQNLL